MGKKQQKSKAIALTFLPFLATFSIFHKWSKTAKKEGYSLYFSSIFSDLFHFWKTGKKQQKSKAIAFNFRPFLAIYFIFLKWAKNSKKVRL